MTFESAAAQVKNLKTSPSNDELLQAYALFKQATVGDNTTSKPNMLDQKGRAKWTSWTEKKGTDKHTAETEYIALVGTLVAKYGV
uniref:ACB domain-containing protein n=1 Tax=Rhabditophanes sp. KR3021 TaxID=114890 RepID=A0AC35TGX4_9BILA